MMRSQCGLKVLVTGTASDSHTWNLVFLQLFLEERGNSVINLGPCVPEELLVDECRAHDPDLLVVSSVNGHGFNDGMRAVIRIRQRPELARLPVVIGGKLGVDGVRNVGAIRRLLAVGYDAVFDDGDLAAFDKFLAALAPRSQQLAS